MQQSVAEAALQGAEPSISDGVLAVVIITIIGFTLLASIVVALWSAPALVTLLLGFMVAVEVFIQGDAASWDLIRRQGDPGRSSSESKDERMRWAGNVARHWQQAPLAIAMIADTSFHYDRDHVHGNDHKHDGKPTNTSGGPAAEASDSVRTPDEVLRDRAEPSMWLILGAAALLLCTPLMRRAVPKLPNLQQRGMRGVVAKFAVGWLTSGLGVGFLAVFVGLWTRLLLVSIKGVHSAFVCLQVMVEWLLLAASGERTTRPRRQQPPQHSTHQVDTATTTTATTASTDPLPVFDLKRVAVSMYPTAHRIATATRSSSPSSVADGGIEHFLSKVLQPLGDTVDATDFVGASLPEPLSQARQISVSDVHHQGPDSGHQILGVDSTRLQSLSLALHESLFGPTDAWPPAVETPPSEEQLTPGALSTILLGGEIRPMADSATRRSAKKRSSVHTPVSLVPWSWLHLPRQPPVASSKRIPTPQPTKTSSDVLVSPFDEARASWTDSAMKRRQRRQLETVSMDVSAEDTHAERLLGRQARIRIWCGHRTPIGVWRRTAVFAGLPSTVFKDLERRGRTVERRVLQRLTKRCRSAIKEITGSTTTPPSASRRDGSGEGGGILLQPRPEPSWYTGTSATEAVMEGLRHCRDVLASKVCADLQALGGGRSVVTAMRSAGLDELLPENGRQPGSHPMEQMVVKGTVASLQNRTIGSIQGNGADAATASATRWFEAPTSTISALCIAAAVVGDKDALWFIKSATDRCFKGSATSQASPIGPTPSSGAQNKDRDSLVGRRLGDA